MQKVVNKDGDVYAELPILAGPHTWSIGKFTFQTVLVRTPDNAKGELSIVHCLSGKRVARVACKAPKRDGVATCAAVIDRLQNEVGADRIIWVISTATTLE